jgi:hypothetical protein
MTFLYALRYFQIVPVVPPMFVAAFVIAVAAAALRLTRDPAAAVDALTPVLLLQILVASSGFKVAARRGYYDLLLTSPTPLWQIALAHCLASITPGILSWMCVGVIEMAASHGAGFASVASGTCAAFVGASLLAWSVAVFSSRMASAVGWLLVMTMWPVASAMSPVTLLGTSALVYGPIALAAACLVVLMVFAAATTAIVRGAVPLEAAQ